MGSLDKETKYLTVDLSRIEEEEMMEKLTKLSENG